MLFKIFVVLIAVGGSVGMQHTDCYVENIEKCDVDRLPRELPETFEELMRDCDILQELIKCAISVSENCEGSEVVTHRLEKLLVYVEKNCQEDSPIYKVISENYECISPIARSMEHECSPLNLVEEHLKLLLSITEETESENLFCLGVVFEITCEAHTISMKCGQEVKETITDILMNTNWNIQDCSEETLTELIPFKEAVELALTESRNTVIDNFIDEDT